MQLLDNDLLSISADRSIYLRGTNNNKTLNLKLMLALIDLFEETPLVKKINLQFKNIKDLTPLMTLLAKFKSLAQLSLHGNKLTHLPPLDNLKTLKVLELSNNPIKFDNILLDRLFNLPKLESLHININSQQATALIENLPKLKYLNGQFIHRQAITKRVLQQELNNLGSKLNEEMKKVRQIYQRMNFLIFEGIESLEEKAQSQLNKQQELSLVFRDVQQEMNYFFSGLQDSLSREGVFAYCKNKLTTVLDNLMIRMLDELGNENAVKIYEEITRIKTENFDIVLRIIFNNSYAKHLEEELDKPTNRLRKETLYLNELFRVKKQLMEVKKQQNKLDQLSNKQIQLQSKINPYAKTSRKNNQTQALERKKSNSLIKSNSKSSFSKSITPTAAAALNRSPSRPLNKSPSNLLNRTPSKVFSKNPSKTKLQLAEVDKKKTKEKDNSKNIPGNKIVSLQQLTILIQDIMSEKRKYNNRHLEKGQNFETTEQFLFSYFSRRYGLKQIALDWSLSTIRSIQRYCRQSIEVEVFGKILKNQLYQHYYDDCKEFKMQIDHTYKREKASANIQQTEFRKLFFYFYSYQNRQTIDKIVSTTKFPMKLQELTYFLQSYKLGFQQKYLQKFVKTFEYIDKQCSGTLKKAECQQLYKRLIKFKQLTESQQSNAISIFNNKIDKLRKNVFIFSQVFEMVHKIL